MVVITPLVLTRVGPFNGLHHMMLEVQTVDDVLRCYERVNDAKIKVTSTLGRHINDGMLSFYMASHSVSKSKSDLMALKSLTTGWHASSAKVISGVTAA